MTSTDAVRSPSPLPLLLALPRGAIAGVPVSDKQRPFVVESALTAFGPFLRTESDLRHAVHRVPARLVLDARGLTPPHVEAAIRALQRGMAVVALRCDDLGRLARWCERILHQDAAGYRWMTAEACQAGRVLELRLDDTAPDQSRWIRVPLQDGEGTEAVLAAILADGRRVRESRIAYRSGPAR
jgi:hypothetical protein